MIDNKRIEFLKKDFVQGFPGYCGFKVEYAGKGKFQTSIEIRPEHTQQDGFVHAGLIAAMADHTAGYSAFTTVSEEFRILTIEFKINFLKPAKGKNLICRSKVLNRGKTIIVAESEIFSVNDMKEKLVAKATVTLIMVPASSFKR
ncbi:Phenylacetic acid degradation-related domain-containing protein [Desulfonema limicola]|uniref:Medium/long-chain acyl-CoA thioesterase YigI n=1 Tax=Desulfonema limicola TaxID=45656 RepID=A0A975BCX8_9BACT|nr:PaaI family thioesterase [Desulfonema limicola]QTA82985.1 Phenylacetic acid degradation-related domain-containing protein [Desulfonema limicola]